MMELENYDVLFSFCAVGFRNRKTKKLFSIGKFSSEANLDTFEFFVHGELSDEQLNEIVSMDEESNYIKEDRDFAEKGFIFKDTESLKKKMMEYEISDKDADLLLEKLTIALADY